MNTFPEYPGDILVVDDQPENVRILSTLLSRKGYKVRGVINGLMALKAAQSTPPDLILLDIMMPEMDGFTVCQHLKAEERTRQIPVIFVSALDEVLDKVRAFQVGAVDYISKPYQWEEVLARIQAHITLSRQRQHIAALLEERKQSEAQLAQLAVIVRSSNDAIISTSLEGQIRTWNNAAERLYGYAAAEVTSHPLAHYLPDVDQDLALLCHGSGLPARTTTHRHRHGHLIEVFVSASLLRDGQGQAAGVSWITKDITEERLLEKRKRQFVSMVSHELRTPLTSIHGSLSVLSTGKLGALSEPGSRLLDIATENTARLIRLVNDILDLEKLGSGSSTPVPQRCDLSQLLWDAADVMRTLAEQNGIALQVSPLEVSLWADPDQLIQVLTNLLSNAIKFSPPGSSVEMAAEMATPQQVAIWVIDRGRGIPTDMLESIFQPFQQVDASDSRRKGGTGLGLAICQSIVQQHGGQIQVESTLGQGSKFCVRLPLSPTPALLGSV